MLFKTALRKAAKLGLAFTAITALLLAGCGGGGSSTTTPPASTAGGVAAVGYPIVGAAVQVRCAAGSALNTTTSGTGTWQVTFSGQTAPCAVQVSGGTINGATNATNFHSITTTTAVNTVNVSPLTDLVVANLVGTSTPSVWFASLSSTPSLLTAFTQTAVDAALTKLVAAFPELPLNTNNPLTMTFSATPGTVGDDMLAALQTAMNNSSTTYATLLSNAAAPGFTAPAAGFGTALTTAYAGTASGGSSAAPATPAGVGATASSATQINVSWANVSGATSYNVYRSTSANVQLLPGNKVTSGTTTTGTPFANSGLAASTQYFYKVTAVNAAGESGGSTEVWATTQAVSTPAPTITNFTPGTGAAGSTVTITGTNLTAVTDVLFTLSTDLFVFSSGTITANNGNSITVTVPASLAAGDYTISVLYPGNELAAAGTFTVTAASVNTPFASIISSFNSAQCQPGASATSYGHCGAAVVMDFNVTVGIYAPCTVTKVGGLLSITQGATTHSATLDGTPADLISFPGANSMSLQASDPALGNYVNFEVIGGVLHASDAYSSWTPLSCY